MSVFQKLVEVDTYTLDKGVKIAVTFATVAWSIGYLIRAFKK